jgi:diguanylate cyclase (GGDEF)-like protein
MDVDRFKTINDDHGHPAGDAVLQQLAGILLRLSRPDDLVSRLGGDEIAVLLPGCPLPVAARRAEQILRAVRTHAFDITEHTAAGQPERTCLSVTLSIGLAHLSPRGRELRSLYAAADRALYEAKRRGRDQGAVAPESSELDVTAAAV